MPTFYHLEEPKHFHCLLPFINLKHFCTHVENTKSYYKVLYNCNMEFKIVEVNVYFLYYDFTSHIFLLSCVLTVTCLYLFSLGRWILFSYYFSLSLVATDSL